jgi:hypothetical protein
MPRRERKQWLGKDKKVQHKGKREQWLRREMEFK